MSISKKGGDVPKPCWWTGSAPRAYERWIQAQGGDPDLARLPRAPVVREGALRATVS